LKYFYLRGKRAFYKTKKFQGGIYTGEVDQKNLPSGWGAWKKESQLDSYKGYWKEGIREGYGEC
jgi:hypothetical protein